MHSAYYFFEFLYLTVIATLGEILIHSENHLIGILLIKRVSDFLFLLTVHKLLLLEH
ncbi:hypothetical protein KPC142_03696 [Klebsiella quasipneumoniae]|nr:hypothetical protein KPC142_03696 [Klebsiella quasipneumoniae]